MIYIYYFFIFIAGTLFGSFLNLVSDRVVKGKSIVTGRSECDFCKKKLTAMNLIPVLSFLIQKGRCDKCFGKLAFYYPLSEIITGIGFVFAAYFSSVFVKFDAFTLFDFTYYAIAMCFYIVLFLTDIKYRLIPNKIVYFAIFTLFFLSVTILIIKLLLYRNQLMGDPFGVYLIKAGFWDKQVKFELVKLFYTLISSFGISAFFLFLIYITKGRGMGGGDLNLGFLVGIFNGFPANILAIFLGFIFGALYSLVLIMFRRKSVKDTIAFGPFLILGSLVSLTLGTYIVDWYIGLFKL